MEFLVKELLLVLLVGNTHYIDVGKPDPAIIYYQDEEAAFMQFPNGHKVEGNWQLTDAGYHVDWTDGPEGEWRVARGDGRLFYVDAEGNDRGDINKIIPGDAAGFAE